MLGFLFGNIIRYCELGVQTPTVCVKSQKGAREIFGKRLNEKKKS
jgi:hypothetical protein